MGKKYIAASAPHGNRVRHKPLPGERAQEIAADPDKYADWTPMKGRGRPRKAGEKPISLAPIGMKGGT